MEAESKLPYSYGSKPEPKLEWKVEQSPYNADIFYVQLLVDEKPTTSQIRIVGTFRLKSRIRRAKKNLLEPYHLCQRESGRVE